MPAYQNTPRSRSFISTHYGPQRRHYSSLQFESFKLKPYDEDGGIVLIYKPLILTNAFWAGFLNRINIMSLANVS